MNEWKVLTSSVVQFLQSQQLDAMGLACGRGEQRRI